MGKEGTFQNDLSLIVGLRNNLEYSKAFYSAIRKLYDKVEIVFVSYGSIDGTHEWLDSLNDPNVKYHYGKESKSLSETYNKGVELATSKLVTYVHNDMIIGEGFVEALIEAWEPGTVTFYSLIEPPVFTDDSFDWKTIKDFGTDLKTFDKKAFNKFVNRLREKKEPPFPTNDHSFFLCVERSWLVSMGGLDSTFNPMFCEDLDLLMRFSIQGAKLVQVPQAIAYHFVSKTSRFSKEYSESSKNIDLLAIRNFYRKWRFHPFAEYRKAYDVVAVVENATPEGLFKIEPFVHKVYTDSNIAQYISKYQHTTRINLKKRVLPIQELKKHDVIIYLDQSKLNHADFNQIQKLSDIISKNEIKNNNPLKRLFKNYKKINFGNIIGEVNDFRSLEENFPVVVNH
ncbi:glycosyltransferase family 2 protein [Sphingobacterium endophyticum]|uniref:glycosyltransferase family 2 protein n=1 Tax=Sphingobacterium endophyticum TaxID=2546448 RepID=UPI0012E238BD|nr:glycosyltransferase [Sphingobacterium endophyticum]